MPSQVSRHHGRRRVGVRMGKARPAALTLKAEEEASSQGTQVLLGTRKGKEAAVAGASRRSRARPTPGLQLTETTSGICPRHCKRADVCYFKPLKCGPTCGLSGRPA